MSRFVSQALVGTLVGASFATATAAQLPSAAAPAGQAFATSEASMLRTDTPATNSGWTVQPIFTVSEDWAGYQPPGILDGIGVFDVPNRPNTIRAVVNHELNPANGYPYTLANGTMLTGARLSTFLISRNFAGGTADFSVNRIGPAYDAIYDRQGAEVTDPAQINETGSDMDGLARFCSSKSVVGGTYGFVDNVYFTGEETGKPFHPHGGTAWALDVEGRELWAVPALGRGAWENFTALETGDDGTVALLGGDDTAGAPLYLYVGQKDALGDGSFLDRNGLAVGDLYAWRADNGDLDPEAFNGLNEFRSGAFVAVNVRDEAQAGQEGYDALGYADSDTLQASADALGCFSFSRPEDLATNPGDGTQAVFASTGRGSLYPSDNWGTVYVVDVDFSDLSALLIVIHDADDLAVPDEGIRSPDNLEWSSDGKIYLQEDRSTSPSTLFGGVTGVEASVWQLDPVTRATRRIAEVDRSAVAPADATDSGAGDLGNWETSGVIDIAPFFPTVIEGVRILLLDVQAHGIQDGSIGGNPLLDEGGQLLVLWKTTQD